ncbi:hypothetical protein CCACVL1_18055 [Corchorus capsularis]|uniref:Uncharacterized protein n=1 Tax=Corchorus capsularis TaxID=210143 RepID=A0A1R3HNQ6_COCAP|nr:hypothetical protein CCACVL1_18055 [Corchorus capsularis]
MVVEEGGQNDDRVAPGEEEEVAPVDLNIEEQQLDDQQDYLNNAPKPRVPQRRRWDNGIDIGNELLYRTRAGATRKINDCAAPPAPLLPQRNLSGID